MDSKNACARAIFRSLRVSGIQTNPGIAVTSSADLKFNFLNEPTATQNWRNIEAERYHENRNFSRNCINKLRVRDVNRMQLLFIFCFFAKFSKKSQIYNRNKAIYCLRNSVVVMFENKLGIKDQLVNQSMI